MSNGNDSLSLNEYLELIKPYLHDLINVHKAMKMRMENTIISRNFFYFTKT